MIKVALVSGNLQDTWCTVHKLRLHGSRICPRCGPRVEVGKAEEIPCGDGNGWNLTCARCIGKYHTCSCDKPAPTGPPPDPDSIPLQQAARELTADERQGADREGWKLYGWKLYCGRNSMWEHESGVVVWKHHAAACVTVHKTSEDVGPSNHPALLDAQRAAEQLAADSRDGWERETSTSYRMGRSGLVYMNLNHAWNAVVWGGKDRRVHPTAIAAMMACERALQERDT